MSVEVGIAELICKDVKDGNILRLQEWSQKHPNFIEMMNQHLGFDALGYSIEKNKWRLLRFLLDFRQAPRFGESIEKGMDSEHDLCSKIITANLHRNQSRINDVLVQLTETWRWK